MLLFFLKKKTEKTKKNKSIEEYSALLLKNPFQSRTWLVHTLLNATNANVCASIVPARSFFANTRGIKIALRASCGIKARDSNLTAPVADGTAEERCKSVLYGEKLWRWSMRVRWCR